MRFLASLKPTAGMLILVAGAVAAVAYPFNAAFRLTAVEKDVTTLKSSVTTIGERLTAIEKCQDNMAANANADRQTWAEIRAAVKGMTESWNQHLVKDASSEFRLGELEKVRTVVNEISASMVKERAANDEFKISVERTLQQQQEKQR